MNGSDSNFNQSTTEEKALELIQVFWLIGLAVSCFCFLGQIIFFVLLKACRNVDEKILAQMTFARIMVTITEFCVAYNIVNSVIWKDLIYTVYFYVDFSLVVWMLVFSKNLYDKIVTVFTNRKISFLVTSILVWTFSLPFSIVAIFLLKKSYIREFYVYYKVYACLKFITVTLNASLYFRIFHVAFKRTLDVRKPLADTLKSAIVAFLLVLTTCLQVFITDVLSLSKINDVAVKLFCVINSFHVILITIIFMIILKSKLQQSITKSVLIRLSELGT